MSQVPDSTPVRFEVERSDPWVSGQALGWQRGSPRIITPRGDTVVVPGAALVQVRLREKTNRAVVGAVVGFVVGMGVSYARCPSPRTSCAEGDPMTPLLVSSLGALVGSRFKADEWVRVPN